MEIKKETKKRLKILISMLPFLIIFILAASMLIILGKDLRDSRNEFNIIEEKCMQKGYVGVIKEDLGIYYCYRFEDGEYIKYYLSVEE